ncbi:MAG: hypothetical protein R3B47_17675 [Bacteroidia bacterium]
MGAFYCGIYFEGPMPETDHVIGLLEEMTGFNFEIERHENSVTINHQLTNGSLDYNFDQKKSSGSIFGYSPQSFYLFSSFLFILKNLGGEELTSIGRELASVTKKSSEADVSHIFKEIHGIIIYKKEINLPPWAGLSWEEKQQWDREHRKPGF